MEVIDGPKQSLPNSAATLVLGICSVVFSSVFIGLILGIIGLAISTRSRSMYLMNPSNYTGYGTLNAGRVLSIIGIVFSSLALIFKIMAVLAIFTFSTPFFFGLLNMFKM